MVPSVLELVPTLIETSNFRRTLLLFFSLPLPENFLLSKSNKKTDVGPERGNGRNVRIRELALQIFLLRSHLCSLFEAHIDKFRMQREVA